MTKFDSLSLATVLAVAAAVTAGCDDDKDKGWDAAAGPTRVCVDAQGKRVPENQCAVPRTGGGVSPFLWYYLGAMTAQRNYVPGYGGVVGGGSFTPAAGTAYGMAPAEGIARGGFGGTARSFGGVGEGVGE